MQGFHSLAISYQYLPQIFEKIEQSHVSSVLQQSILNSPVSTQQGFSPTQSTQPHALSHSQHPKKRCSSLPFQTNSMTLEFFLFLLCTSDKPNVFIQIFPKHVLGVFPLLLFDFPRLKFSHFQSLDNVNPYSYKRHANFIFKELSKSHLRDHIFEANHLEDISHTCQRYASLKLQPSDFAGQILDTRERFLKISALHVH